MSKKRRVFDIDMPEDVTGPVVTPSPERGTRRGPMAAAVQETAQSLGERAALEAEIRAENDRLAHEHVRLKKAGLITDLVPLDEIRTSKLTRDRAAAPDPELEELVTSIQSIGLSNPIQIEQAPGGGYELVQGFRRLSAWRLLLEQTGDAEKWGRIPATILAPGEKLEGLYRRMVDENLVRRDISFAEMAQLARAYAADPETPVDDPDAAVLELYRSAGKQKRSYIRAFCQLLETIAVPLAHAQAIPRALGLELRKALDESPERVESLRQALTGLAPGHSAEEELALLRSYAAPVRIQKDPQPRAAKTTFRLQRKDGEARCTASNGRLEIRLGIDFSAKDRHRLEAAIAAMLSELDE